MGRWGDGATGLRNLPATLRLRRALHQTSFGYRWTRPLASPFMSPSTSATETRL